MRDQNISDSLLELLGNYFVSERLFSEGWTFEQFVKEYQLGFIAMK